MIIIITIVSALAFVVYLGGAYGTWTAITSMRILGIKITTFGVWLRVLGWPVYIISGELRWPR